MKKKTKYAEYRASNAKLTPTKPRSYRRNVSSYMGGGMPPPNNMGGRGMPPPNNIGSEGGMPPPYKMVEVARNRTLAVTLVAWVAHQIQ